MNTRSRRAGFTLVEVIAAAAVIALLMLMLVQMSKQTGETWKKGLSRAEQFRETRRAFEIVTRRLATATLNTYWDYQYATGIDPANPGQNVPVGYQRQSELRFRVLPMSGLSDKTGYHPTHGVFFQSATGSTDIDDTFWTTAYPSKSDLSPVSRLDGMLNTWGYFLEVNDVTTSMPEFLGKSAPPVYRSRLMEFREDATRLSVYKLKIDQPRDDWFTTPLNKTDATRPVHAVAENIIAMVLLPRLSANDEATRAANAGIPTGYRYLTPAYDYDSKRTNNYGVTTVPANALPNQINPYNQLPPVVQVAMFALDESSAARLSNEASEKQRLDLPTLLGGLFQRSDYLEQRDGGVGDLATLESRLLARRLNYRLFVSNISIRGARWSATQPSQ